MDVEALFHAYKDDVYRLALSFTRNPAEAEDVCQTAFLKLMEQKQIAPGKERAWLMQVTANACRNLLRSGWWKKTLPLDGNPAATLLPEKEIYHSVMALPPKYRVVIYLRYYEEMTTKEMAQLLHISQSAVTTRLNRARQLLKQELREEMR